MNVSTALQQRIATATQNQSGEVQAAVMKKALGAQRSEGEAVLELLQKNAPAPARNLTPGLGQNIDIYA